MMLVNKPEERIIIIAPAGQDAPAMAGLLGQRGIEATICEDADATLHQLADGAGALLFTEEALNLPRFPDVLESLQHQPNWSELPLIILTRGSDPIFTRVLDAATHVRGNVTLLERPLGSYTLLRSVEVALRSRRRQYQVRDLLADKARLASIVESSDDAIISEDLQGIILTWNRGAERLFGYTAVEAIGESITMLIPENRLEEKTTILDRVRVGMSLEHYETIRRCKDGQLLDIALTVSPIRDPQGRIIGASKIARDITQRKRTEKALVDAQAKLQEHASKLEQTVAKRTQDLRATNEQLEEFVYSIAHDLRSPLRTMHGFSELLISDHGAYLNEDALYLLKRIQASSQFMDKLLLDLLAYGRTARAEMEISPVDVRKAWNAAMFQCVAQIQETQAEIETKDPLGKVLAHEATLGQCLANLLSNALKFVAPNVRPQVRCWSEQRENRIRIWVADNGLGIPPQLHERIFRVFERLHGSRYTGTGIGLSIVRKGVERMGGTIGLESEPDKGSKFWIELPKAQ